MRGALSLVGAHLLLPTNGEGYLRVVEMALAPLEVLVIVFLMIKVRQIREAYRDARTPSADFQTTVEEVLERVIDHPRTVRILATELSLIHYGLFAWRNRPEYTNDGEVFTYHRNSGYGLIAGVFLFLIAVETPVLHLFVSSRFPILAWVITAALMPADMHRSR